MDSKLCLNNLLLDVGGTFIKAGLSIGKNQLIPDSFYCVPMDSAGSKESILKSLTDTISQGYESILTSGNDLSGIGICFPGPFDYDRGIALMKHKFASIYGIPLKEFILGSGIVPSYTPILFMHDVNAMLSGEMAYGNGQGFSNIALISLGTGLGFAQCIDGQIQYSETKSPKESIFSLPYGDGILEDYVSKRGFLRNYSDITGAPTPDGLTVKEIGMMAAEGDEPALETFRRVGSIIAQVISPILISHRIECLLFGGQISKSYKFMEESINSGLKDVTTLKKIAPVKHIAEASFYGLCSIMESLNK
jgi:glucokinase